MTPKASLRDHNNIGAPCLKRFSARSYTSAHVFIERLWRVAYMLAPAPCATSNQ